MLTHRLCVLVIVALACLLLGGKDAYPEVYRARFGSNPKASPPTVFQ